MPRYINPQPQYFTDLGLPLTGGKLYFYEPSSLLPKDTYSNAALTTPNTNPVTMAANGSPSVDIWLSGVYRVRLFDAIGNLIWDKDPVGGDSSSIIAYSNWLSGLSYPAGEIVTGSNGRYYVSILSPNTNNDPISSPVYWSETRLLRVYNSNETYQINDLIQDADGFLWRAKLVTAGTPPALGSAFWEPAVEGIGDLDTLSRPQNVAGPATLAKSAFYRLTASATYTLPSATGVSESDPIFLSKAATVTPNVQAQPGQKIRIGKEPSATLLYDNFTYNTNATITLISNGTDWELS